MALSDDGAIEFGLYAQEKNALNVTQELWYSSGAEYLAQNVQGPRRFYLQTHMHTCTRTHAHTCTMYIHSHLGANTY